MEKHKRKMESQPGDKDWKYTIGNKTCADRKEEINHADGRTEKEDEGTKESH
jgi:hypothetical protein